MQTEEFIARVTAEAPGHSPERAFDITLPTLEALSEHLPAEEARRLAAQLPRGLAEAVEAGGAREDRSGRPVGLNEFNTRLAARAEVSPELAQEYSIAVARVLRQAVSEGELTDVALELPEELTSLLNR